MVTVSFDGYTYGRSQEAKFVRVTQPDPNEPELTQRKSTRPKPDTT